MKNTDLPGTVKATGWAIALHADLQGTARLKYETIADACGLGRSTVARSVAALVSGGWLDVQNRTNGHGKQANSYLLIMPVDNPNHSPTAGLTIVPQRDGVSPTAGRRERPTAGHRSEGLIEVSGTDPTARVDNPHLAALLANMSRDHGVPS